MDIMDRIEKFGLIAMIAFLFVALGGDLELLGWLSLIAFLFIAIFLAHGWLWMRSFSNDMVFHKGCVLTKEDAAEMDRLDEYV